MKFKTRSLYQLRQPAKKPMSIVIAICMFVALIVLPMQTIGLNRYDEPYQQTFVLTAYYSPLPQQCCYVKGGLVADRILNGQGTHGADGTAVYPGMLAAPGSYPFGTRIDLEGLGVMTVHDRGGAIRVMDEFNGRQGEIHRLDVWAGHGEEGLARALAFGVQTISATVYPPGTAQPAETFELANLPAPPSKLRDYLVHGENLMAMEPGVNDTSLAAEFLQSRLQQLGYLDQAPTGFYGEKTQTALQRFITDHTLGESAERLSPTTAAYVLAATRRQAAREPVSNFIDDQASEQDVMDAQRILRFLGYYRGRTDGLYDDDLKAAILAFQQAHHLVGTAEDPGAGRIGPITKRTLLAQWNKKLVAKRANTYLAVQKVSTALDDRGWQVDRYLSEGYSGNAVSQLQAQLAELGFFDAELANGYFGEMTKEAVVNYQLSRNIINSRGHESAGYIGPATLSMLRKDQLKKHYAMVRSNGWGAL